MSKLIIIGGGASGMMAAVLAGERGIETVIVEKNEKLGKKLYITGKGRCNVTNACDTQDFFKNVVSNPKFLYSAVYGFDPYAVMDFFEAHGLKLKVERGNRVFPVSDRSSDVIKCLKDSLSATGVRVMLNTKVTDIICENGRFLAVELDNGKRLEGDYCFVATGGLSYPSTGSTGDGFNFANMLGHKVTRLIPSLVSLRTEENYVSEMEGLSLKNVVLTAYSGNKQIYSDLGEMLFTHNGVSGPLVLSLSAIAAGRVASGEKISLTIDLKPALDEGMLDARILRDFSEGMNRNFANSLGGLLPSSMIPVIVRLSGIKPDKQVNAVTKEERAKLLSLIKAFPLHVLRLGGFDEAVITKGGVSVKEIDPQTMGSKLCEGLYFIGEVLDLDAFTGGYNLQIAWSTAHAAALSIPE